MFSAQDYAQRIATGDKNLLSQAITYLESTLPEHQNKAQKILAHLKTPTKPTYRIAISGAPGLGKSTFIDTLGIHLIKKQHKVAVLAIDPSSSVSGGSILGDKTRMVQLLQHHNAFIRPSPSGFALGGIIAATQESILLCEAAGFDVILIETVGVGQAETMAKNISDIFLLLAIAGAGDELQGIKRGIMEMANLIIINKAEKENKIRAEAAAQEIRQALHYFSMPESDWTPKALLCSALENQGFEEIIHQIFNYFSVVQKSGFLEKNRKNQLTMAFEENIKSRLYRWLLSQSQFSKEIALLKDKIEAENISVGSATQLFFDFLQSKVK